MAFAYWIARWPSPPTPEIATYPSRLPLLPLDRIWFSGPLKLTTIATLRDAGRASDHLPLLASLCWPAAEKEAEVGTGFALQKQGI
jgi:endonuclease/exonuclease/phosphatase family metal-dependent hydrolase